MGLHGFSRHASVAVLIFTGVACAAHVQVARPDLPIDSAGTVVAIARQSDGSLIIGGQFTRIDGVPRTNLARLHADGTLDLAWNPSTDGYVAAIAIDANDDVIVAGGFDHVDGLARDSLAKVAGDGSGAVFETWNPGAVLHSPGPLEMLALGRDGAVFTGGDLFDDRFVDYRVAKIAADGTVDLDWNPGIENFVDAIAADPFGALYVSVSGCCLFKLQTSGHGDPVAGWQPYEAGGRGMRVGADGYLYLPLDPIVRFAPDSHGEIDASWHPDVSAAGTAWAIDGDAIYVAHDFQYPDTDARIVKVTTGSGTVTRWQVPGRGVSVLAIGADHSVYAGGHFEDSGGVPPGLQAKLSLARLASVDGSALPTVDAMLPGSVNAIARQSDGGLIIGGHFSRAGTIPRSNLLRMTPDGSLDLSWNPALDDYSVAALAVDEHDDVYVGAYDYLGTRHAVLRFDGHDPAGPRWDATANSMVMAVATDGHGSLYAGGYFSSIGGAERQNVAKLATIDGTPDPAWSASTVDPVQSILVDRTAGVESIVLGSGDVGYPPPGSGGGAVYQGAITRVSPASGQPAPGQPLSLQGVARALAVAPDGSLYAAGTFVIDDGARYVDAIKIDPDGSLDLAWARGLGFVDKHDGFAVVVDDRGDVQVGGRFQLRNDAGLTTLAPYLMKRDGSDGTVGSGPAPAFVGSHVLALQPLPGGGLVLGGIFSTIDGIARDSFATLSTAAGTPGHSPHVRPGTAPPKPVPSPGRLRPATPAGLR